MASLTNAANGTKSSTVGGTPDTLATLTTSDVFVCIVNVTNMQATDTIEVYADTKVLAGGTSERAGGTGQITGVQTDKRIWFEFVSEHEAVVKLHHSAGTSRNFEWSIAKAS